MGKAIGFDLGSSCTAYCDRDNKDIMMMPSIIACDRKTKQTLAVGSEARKMIGRTPSSIELIRPIRGGIITDIDSTSVLLGEIADLLGATSVFKKADRYVAIPFGISKSDENAFKDAILAVGLGTINYVDTAKAIALGAGMPLDSTAGRMIVDIGASCATASIISHGDVVISGSAKYAGDAMTSAIADYITEVHGIEVGELTAEAIKIKLGTLDPTSQPKTLKISGKAKPDKNPKLAGRITASTTISSHELIPILSPIVDKIISEVIIGSLENTPPEISSDISDFGILLSGGSAMLDGIVGYLRGAVGVKVSTTKTPAQDAARGLWRVIKGGRAYARFTR